jgi:hypothetical protein
MGDIGIGGRIVRFEDVDRIYLIQDRVEWWAVVSMVMNLWIP